MLKNKFYTLAHHFTTDEKLIDSLWRGIHTQYSEPHRHYHTLKHLEHLYKELEMVALNPVLEFAIFYHDIIYDVSKQDNEEQSAIYAQKRLKALMLPEELIEDITQLILLSKSHNITPIENAKLFLDADISILGASPSAYEQYTQKIRKEYRIYDDATYKSGRTNVLANFLEKPRLYQSDYFYHQYEAQARNNIVKEYAHLDLF
jgi:predicted metal-dependent HD superfamily phosphohydrolase